MVLATDLFEGAVLRRGPSQLGSSWVRPCVCQGRNFAGGALRSEEDSRLGTVFLRV